MGAIDAARAEREEAISDTRGSILALVEGSLACVSGPMIATYLDVTNRRQREIAAEALSRLIEAGDLRIVELAEDGTLWIDRTDR